MPHFRNCGSGRIGIYFKFVLLTFTVVEFKNGVVGAKRIPSKGVVRPNVCPSKVNSTLSFLLSHVQTHFNHVSDICRITETNENCSQVPILEKTKQVLNMSEICYSFLANEFSNVEDCEMRCEGCAWRVVMARCSLRKLDTKYGECAPKPLTARARPGFP